jgi:hypothetical protein
MGAGAALQMPQRHPRPLRAGRRPYASAGAAAPPPSASASARAAQRRGSTAREARRGERDTARGVRPRACCARAPPAPPAASTPTPPSTAHRMLRLLYARVSSSLAPFCWCCQDGSQRRRLCGAVRRRARAAPSRAKLPRRPGLAAGRRISAVPCLASSLAPLASRRPRLALSSPAKGRASCLLTRLRPQAQRAEQATLRGGSSSPDRQHQQRQPIFLALLHHRHPQPLPHPLARPRTALLGTSHTAAPSRRTSRTSSSPCPSAASPICSTPTRRPRRTVQQPDAPILSHLPYVHAAAAAAASLRNPRRPSSGRRRPLPAAAAAAAATTATTAPARPPASPA